VPIMMAYATVVQRKCLCLARLLCCRISLLLVVFACCGFRPYCPPKFCVGCYPCVLASYHSAIDPCPLRANR